MGSLSDYLKPDLEIVIVGINPGVASATKGHHYAGAGNHFWPNLYESGLISEQLTANEDCRVLEFGIGLTNLCDRVTKSSTDLKPKELRESGEALKMKLIQFAPAIVVFNGKIIYEYFSRQRPSTIAFGLQRNSLTNSKGEETMLFVMPSSSPRCATYPRASDKLPFYVAIRELRDQLRKKILRMQSRRSPYFEND